MVLFAQTGLHPEVGAGLSTGLFNDWAVHRRCPSRSSLRSSHPMRQTYAGNIWHDHNLDFRVRKNWHFGCKHESYQISFRCTAIIISNLWRGSSNWVSFFRLRIIIIITTMIIIKQTSKIRACVHRFLCQSRPHNFPLRLLVHPPVVTLYGVYIYLQIDLDYWPLHLFCAGMHSVWDHVCEWEKGSAHGQEPLLRWREFFHHPSGGGKGLVGSIKTNQYILCLILCISCCIFQYDLYFV